MRISFRLASGEPIPYYGVYSFKIINTVIEHENNELFLICVIELIREED